MGLRLEPCLARCSGATRLPSLPGALHPCRLPMTSLVPVPLLPGEGECLVDPVLVPAVADQQPPPCERQTPQATPTTSTPPSERQTHQASAKRPKRAPTTNTPPTPQR